MAIEWKEGRTGGRVRYLAAVSLLLAGVPLALGLARAMAPALPDDPFELTGIDYVQMSPEEREAYVAGFITGAATIQALTAAGGAGPLAVRLDALRESGELRFPFGTGVYATVLREYFTSPETASQRILQALVIVHEHLASERGEI